LLTPQPHFLVFQIAYSLRGLPNTKTEIISNFKILIKNNEEELELLNYFQKLIFHEKFATP